MPDETKDHKVWYEHLTARFADPFLSSFMIFFVINEWKFFYVLLWSKYPAEYSISIALRGFCWHWAILAFVEAAFYTFVWPKISHYIEAVRHEMGKDAELDQARITYEAEARRERETRAWENARKSNRPRTSSCAS